MNNLVPRPDALNIPVSKAIDHLAFTGSQDSIALAWRDNVYSYNMLNVRIAAIAQWLSTKGLRKGDRIATWLNKTDIACWMPLAAVRAGLIHVPINPLLKPAQVEHILTDSGSRMLIANRARLNLCSELADLSCDFIEDKLLYELPEAGPDWLAGSDGEPNDLAAILYTSGSTGRPKGVMLSNMNLWLGAKSVAEYLKLGISDRVLCVLPLSFDYGQNQLFSTWYAGGTCFPMDYLTPRDVIKGLGRHNITTLAAVPPLWSQLIEQKWPENAVRDLRRLTNSGGALTPRLIAGLRGQAPKADIYPMYGLTEAFRSTYLDPELVEQHPTSIGNAIPYAQILLVDKDDMVVEGEGEGELVHCGPLVAHGYWRDAERTKRRFKPAPQGAAYKGMAVWSGDKVRRDAQGLLYFVGRDDAMIKSSGNRISPTEVEEAAIATGLIKEAVALGQPHEQLGQAIILVANVDAVSDLPDDDIERALLKAMKPLVPAYMLPATIVLRDNLPRNPNGKIDRTLLMKGLVG